MKHHLITLLLLLSLPVLAQIQPGGVGGGGGGGGSSGFDSPTNTFTGTSFPMGTNAFIRTSTNIYITALLNVPTTTSRVGQLTIVATADISITNAGAMRASDQVTSRLIPSGSTAKLRMEVQTGSYTNLDVVIY